MKFEFGKYRGCDIRSVPDDYLNWLMAENRRTLAAAEAELERRRQEEEEDVTMLELIIKTGFRELAKRFHPDVGGDPDKMRELLGAKETIALILEDHGYNSKIA